MTGGNEQAGTIYYDAIIETKSLKVTAAQAESIIKGSVGRSSNATAAAGKEMSSSLNGVAQSLAIVGSGYVALRGASSFLKQSINDANEYGRSIAGLASVSQAFGEDTDASLQAARDFAADGLIPLAQATQAYKTALASGYSLEQATQLLSGLKDQAVNNRQSYYDLGGAVNATMEGIKNGNSVLADATGTTKNLSVIAKEAGIGIDEMGSVSQNTAYRTAILNAFLQESSRSMGDAAKFADTAAGADARLQTNMLNLRIEVGQLANALRQEAVGSLGQFIASNQQAIIAIGSGTAAFGTFAAGSFIMVRSIGFIMTALKALTVRAAIAGGVVGALSVAFGVIAGVTVGNLLDELDSADKSTGNIDRNTAKVPENIAKSSKEANKLAKELAKIDEQTEKTNRDFREQLAELVRDKNESIAQLKSQLDQEKAEYTKSYNDRLYDFNRTQQEESSTHQQKVARLTTQIDFLRKYQNSANRQQLTDLQFSLARENALYTTQLQERQTKYNEDAENERLSYEKRRLESQARLDAETSLLARHRNDVNSIRGVILLDEIDKLKRSRDEQLRSYAQQRADAIANAHDTNAQTINALASNREGFRRVGTEMGNAMGNALKEALKNAVVDTGKGVANFLGSASTFLAKGFDPRKGGQSLSQIWQEAQRDPAFGFRASGGSVSAGKPYIVGENPDGSLNSTSEMFVPNRSGTIIPSDKLQSALGGGGNQNVSITVNLSGVMTDSRSGLRVVANQLVDAINEQMRSKNLPQVGVTP